MGVAFLLDTNVLSDPLKLRPSAKVKRKLLRKHEQVATCAIVWHELVYGAERLASGRRKDRIKAYLAGLRGELPILEYNTEAADWHAEQRAKLAAKGIAAAFADAQIAAIAAVNELTLVTQNVRDFRRFSGLRVIDWSR